MNEFTCSEHSYVDRKNAALDLGICYMNPNPNVHYCILKIIKKYQFLYQMLRISIKYTIPLNKSDI